MKVWLSGLEKLLMSRAAPSGHSAGGLEDKSAKRNVGSGGSAYESSQGDKDSIRNWIRGNLSDVLAKIGTYSAVLRT